MKTNNELLAVMEKCGHFLYHRRGGKRGQGRILKLLASKGSLTQTELQEFIPIRSGSLSETIKKLEDQGLLERKQDESDRRKYKLTLTQKGSKLVHDNEISNREQEKQLFTGLTNEEQEELKGLMTKLLASWEETFDEAFFEHRKQCRDEQCKDEQRSEEECSNKKIEDDR